MSETNHECKCSQDVELNYHRINYPSEYLKCHYKNDSVFPSQDKIHIIFDIYIAVPAQVSIT